MVKRKSGNGTIARQDLYLVVCWPYVFLWKIGISKDAKQRARQISQEKVGSWHVVARARIEFAYHIEQIILALTLLFFWPFFGGVEVRWGPLWLLLAPIVWALAILRFVIVASLLLLAFYALFWFQGAFG